MSDSSHIAYVWFWRCRLPERKGNDCRVIARGAMNSILVEFADGFRVVTSRYAVRKKKTPAAGCHRYGRT